MTDTTGSTENPGDAVEEAVRRSLALVDTWIHWDGRPCVCEDGDRVYTPAKAVLLFATDNKSGAEVMDALAGSFNWDVRDTGNAPVRLLFGLDGVGELPVRMLSDTEITPFYDAVIESTEEAILNAMLASETMTGRNGNTVHALDPELLLEALPRQA